jgi:hypothetical protein
MKWINAKDKLPANREEVLIRHKEDFHLAVFFENEKRFVIDNGSQYKVDGELLWSRLIGSKPGIDPDSQKPTTQKLNKKTAQRRS